MNDMGLSRRDALKAVVTGVVGASTMGKAQATQVDGRTNDGNTHNSRQSVSHSMSVIHRDRLEKEGIAPGEQVRLIPKAASPVDSVVKTVPRTIISTNEWNCRDVCKQFDIPTDTELDISSHVVHPEINTATKARERDEFFERITKPDVDSSVIVTAPHGGYIEHNTDKQAKRVAEELDITEWSCLGYNNGGGAFARWHVTSTEISRRSFPKLDQIAENKFSYAISFHGFTDSGIAVGGGISKETKEEICEAIETATDGKYDVYIPRRDSRVAGTSPRNFVNWLTDDNNGLQLEQSHAARQDDWEAIALAVSDVVSEW